MEQIKSAGYKLLSHPEVLLCDHLITVQQTGLNIFDQNGLFPEYRPILEAALLLHDFGKASIFFQRYIREPDKHNTELKNHAELSALLVFHYLRDILKVSDIQAYYGYIIVKSHHKDLIDFNEIGVRYLEMHQLSEINQNIDYISLEPIFRLLISPEYFTAANLEEKLQFKDSSFSGISLIKWKQMIQPNDFQVLNYLFSILIYADKNSAIYMRTDDDHVEIQWNKEFIPEFKKSLTQSARINELRERVYLDVINSVTKSGSRILSINLPTGSGKTLTALQAAMILRDRYKQKKRIIYALPFTSIIDQNADVMKKILEENNIDQNLGNLLIHHHNSLRDMIDEDDAGNDMLFPIETWQSEMIITTFYQLLYCIFTNQNSMLKRMFTLAHSIIILDEVQTIDFKYWALINTQFTKMAEMLDIHFILCTATMPLIFSEEKNEITELATHKKEYFHEMNRISLIRKNPSSIDSFIKFLVDQIKAEPDKSRLIILNTIKSSLHVYHAINEQIPQADLVYLSTNIIPKHRLERIREIKESNKGKIVVSTQLVEAGVDIDLDIVYRDMAPLDAIFQAAGRCKRNEMSSNGIVELWELHDDKNKYYWSYIYDTVLIDCTKKIVPIEEVIRESSFYELSHQYYSTLMERKNNQDSKELIKFIEKLQYHQAFHLGTGKNQYAFELIKELPKVPVFIEFDDEASSILQRYYDLKRNDILDRFEKKRKLKLIWSEMSQYIVLVHTKSGKQDSESDLQIIDQYTLSPQYDKDTGYYTEPKYEDCCF